MGVSINTIRRDINELAANNHVQKFYGGVSLARENDSHFQSRNTINLEEKKKVAKAAAALIKDNDMIFIDSGSTTSLIIDYLNRNDHLTIVTNNLHVTNKVINIENWNLIIVGTQLRHSSHSLINVQSWDYLDSLNLNKAFIATTGLTIKSGATNTAMEETIIKSKLMKRSNFCYLVMDPSKFDRTSLVTFAKISDFDGIITSGDVPKHFLDYFKEHNIQLTIAQ